MAVYYFRNTGNVNWGTASNWSLTDGGGATGAVPTASDDALLTSNSGNCTVNTSARSCLTLTTTGYTGTLTLDVNLQVFGNIVIGATTSISALGAGYLVVAATSSITSNAVVVPNFRLGLTTLFTATLIDALNANNVIVAGNNGVSFTLNGADLNVVGNSSITVGTSFITTLLGSSNVNVTGTTTISNNASSVIRSNININSSQTVTILGTLNYNTGTFTYTAGLVLAKGSTLAINSTTTFNSGIIEWENVTISGNIVITILGNFNLCGTLQFGNTTQINQINTGTINAYGNINITQTAGGVISGSATLNVLGDGITFSSSGGTLRLNTNINSKGAVTIQAPTFRFNYDTGTLTYLSGYVNAKNVVLGININTTLRNMNKIVWGLVLVTGNVTLTMNEFFCGSAENKTIIYNGGSGARFFVNFANPDGSPTMEKISYYVRVFSCSVINQCKLIIVTDQSNSTCFWNGPSPFTITPSQYVSNVGIRYINQSPNSVPKNLPSVGNNGMTFPTFGITSDPAMN
jgi:hypothetical protein